MLKLCRVANVKVFLLVLVYVFNFDLLEFSATILEKGLLALTITRYSNKEFYGNGLPLTFVISKQTFRLMLKPSSVK